jgi:hypothetical protein
MIRYLEHAAYRLHKAPRWILAGCCGLILTSCSKSHDDSAKSAVPGQSKTKAAGLIATNSTPVLAQVPRSVFSTNVDQGLDPFFPDSTRRLLRTAASATPVARPTQPSSNFLKLTGLWPSKSRPLALVNKTTIAPGEEANITVVVQNGHGSPESHRLRVHCLEVRQNSVLISIDGESGTKELILQSKL